MAWRGSIAIWSPSAGCYPSGLLDLGAPSDEYAPEIGTIIPRLANAQPGFVRTFKYGYDSHIKGLMRSANIAELRNRLTQYLREVRAGEEIVVRDRQRPIAKIVPFTVDEDEEDADLVAAGVIRKGTGKLPRSFWSRRRRPGVSWEVAVAAVRADRDED